MQEVRDFHKPEMPNLDTLIGSKPLLFHNNFERRGKRVLTRVRKTTVLGLGHFFSVLR